ncbi:Acylamino-acid-releasing enzyme isoform 2 [Schistosoma japonicum]|uniref:Acylamino-acid-releasing enzyme n=1 Tax=Schistosoma japonicum TaxID=6182 RepID=A0A4Z2CQM4_SCHJA|nr:Acylamino-acid-releasing enzyme isoform 2 [Schistosoma japonicum]
MLPKKTLSALFGFLNTPMLSESKVFKCPDHVKQNEYCIISKWIQIDTFRKDNVTYSRTHLVTLPQHNMHEGINMNYVSQLQFHSFGQSFPFTSQNHVRTIWDIQSPEGSHRAICIECNPPLASNTPKSTTASSSESGTFVQVWINGHLTNSIKLPTASPNARHGRVYPSDGIPFHGAAWSNARDKIVYLAEEIYSDSSEDTAHCMPFKGNDSSFMFREDWGEGNDGSRKPIVCILDLNTEAVVFAPIEDEYNLASNEPLWSPDDRGIVFVGYHLQSYNLGLVYCVQRSSQLYFWDITKGRVEPISVPGQSVQCPRFSPDGAYLIWLQNPVGGPHGQCVSLVGIHWPIDCLKPDVIIPIVDNPCSTDEFPGLYCKLTNRCWSADSQCILVSSSWGFEVVGLVISITESIAQSRPVIYKLPKVNLTLDMITSPSSLSILDFHDDILVASVSTPIHPHHMVMLNLKNLDYTNLSHDLSKRPWLILSDGMDSVQNSLRSLKGIDWSIHQIELEKQSDQQKINSFEYLLIHPKLKNDGSIEQIDTSDITFGKDLREISSNKLRGLIVMPHGGPHSQSSTSWSSMVAGFCISGFACLLINYRGSLGYGNAFIQDLIGYIGEKDVSDCVQATECALNYLQKYESNLKAVLFGGSHGGFLTLHLAARYNNLYHVAAARNPVTHLVSLIDTSDIPDWCYTESGLTDWCEWPLGHLPSSDELIRLSTQSPLTYLNKTWSVPLLMLLGGKDRRVPNSQGITFCRKLKAICPTVPCETLLYPHDSHPLESPACSLDVFVNCLNCLIMTNIDSYFEEFLDNEDDDQERANKSLQDMRSGVIFLVDCTPTMLGLHGTFNDTISNNNSVDTSSVKTGFDLSLLCCQTYQQNKALHSPFDMIGLILMRTNESSGDMKNIVVLQPLGLADSTRILEIEKLRQLKPSELEKRFGTIVNQPNIAFPLHEVLWTCQNLFITCSKTFGIKHIFLLTDDPDPVNQNAYLKRRAITKMADMKQYGIELEVIPIKQQSTQFNYALFYDELLEDELKYPDIDRPSYHPDPTERLDELLTRVNSHELRRSRLARIPFHLGPSKNLTLGISVYCLIRPTRIPSPMWLSSSDNKPVTVQRNYYKIIDSYGSFDPVKDLLPSHDLVRGMKLDGRYICFDKDELNEAMRNITPVGKILIFETFIEGIRSQRF